MSTQKEIKNALTFLYRDAKATISLMENHDFEPSEDDEGYHYERLEHIRKLRSYFKKQAEFIEAVYEIAFGDNAINRDFSSDEVLKELRKFSDYASTVQEELDAFDGGVNYGH